MKTTEPARPGGVPAAAWWSPADNEWILGERDGECEHALGKPHGLSLRFHETGEISQRCRFERGELHGLREWFMTDGVTRCRRGRSRS